MLRSLLLAATLPMALGAPTGDIQVSLSPVSSSVRSIQDIVITATVSNPTNQDIRVLAVNNILDSSPTQSFTVSKDTEEIGFTGIRAIFDMSTEGVYKVIPAGSSVTVNHTNLAPLYSFQFGGAGKFKFTSRPLYLAGANKAVTTNTVDVTVEVTDDVLRRNLGSVNKSTPSCSNPQQLQFITRTVAEALQLAQAAAWDILLLPNSAEFRRFFKTNNPATIRDMFSKIAADQGNWLVSCTDPLALCNGPQGTIAYTTWHRDENGNSVTENIFTCPVFFTIPPTPQICQTGYDSTTSSDASVIVHELSHANSGTGDYGYGCSVNDQLPAETQLVNADNFRCMSMAVYYRNVCRR